MSLSDGDDAVVNVVDARSINVMFTFEFNLLDVFRKFKLLGAVLNLPCGEHIPL